MMKVLLGVCITSGVKGPETELSEELSKEITKLALGLDKPWTGSKFAGHGLSPDHYFVYWEDQTGQIQGLRTTVEGFVSMWKQGDTDWHDYEDTVGLWATLAPYAAKAYQDWVKEGQKQMDDYIASTFKYEPPDWEPNL